MRATESAFGWIGNIVESWAIARLATREALRGYPPITSEHLTLGSRTTDEEGSFELYLCGERPEDAQVLTCTTVDRITGAVKKVEIFMKPLE